MNKLQIGVIAGLILLVVGGLSWEKSYYAQQPAPKAFGTANQRFAQLQAYALSGAGASSGATSITLKSMKDIDGNALTMAGTFGTKGFGTLEPGNGSQEEQISFTGLVNNSNGTVTLTGVSSVSFTYPYTETSGLAKTHPGSATFVISNTSGFYNELSSTQNDESIYGIYTYSSTSPPRLDSVAAQGQGNYIATTSEFATVAYVLTTTLSGAANASQVAKGVVQLATALQTASSTAQNGGSTGASLALYTANATDTPQSGCASGYSATAGAGCTVIAQLTGKIRQTFINLGETYVWTAQHTFSSLFATNASSTNATSTNFAIGSGIFGINGVNYRFTSSAPSATSSLMDDSSGRVSWGIPHNQYTLVGTSLGASAQTATSSQSITIPGGTLNASSSIRVLLNLAACNNSSGGATCTVFLRTSTGVTLGQINTAVSAGVNSGSWTGGFLTLFNNSLASETTLDTCFSVAPGSPTTAGCGQGATSASVDFTNAVTLTLVATSPANTTFSVDNWAVVVSP